MIVMKKLKCSFCQENLEFENHKYKCPICDKEWSDVLLESKNYFDLDCVFCINPIIALEYFTFKSFLLNKQIYGIILQIKDIYEIIIRIPVLIICSFVLSNHKTSKGKELLLFMMSKPLSLGDWRYLLSLASDAAEELKDYIPLEIINLVNVVKKFVNSEKNGDIVYWRNSTISHGAVKQLDDEDLYNDASTKLEEITLFLKNNASLFQTIDFVDENDNKLDGLNHTINKSGKVFLKINEKEYTLYPFFTIKDEGIFLFDRYVKKIRKTDVIDYVKSTKDSVNFEELNNIFLENSVSNFNSKNNIDTYAIEERNLCEDIANSNEFLLPEYLIDILNNELKSNKSVFSIQMEKGMGKSYFTKGLDPFSLNNIYVDDLIVKAFYVNSTYNSRVNDFCICVEDLMRKKSIGFTIANSVIRLDINSANPKKAFASFLNEYKSKYYFDKKILFVFDGIDELKIQDDRNITDFIPETTDLDEGIYVMITLRTNSSDDKLSPFISDFISNFQCVKYYFTKSNRDYLLFAKKYYDLFFVKKLMLFCKKNKIDNNIDISKMSEKFDNIDDKSMLNLSIIRELTLLQLNDNLKNNDFYLDVDNLSFGSDMYLSYFNSIKTFYGSKYYEKFINVLCCLTLSDRSLSVEELSILSGNNNLNFAFLGFINSMKMFLDTTRDDKGTLFSISHSEIKQIIFSTFNEEMNKLKKNIINRINNVSNENFSYINIEDSIFYSCLGSILNSFDSNNADEYLLLSNVFYSILKLPLDFNWGETRSVLLSELDVLKHISFFETILPALNQEQLYRYFMILSKIGFNMMLLNRRSVSEEYFRLAINIYKDANMTLIQKKDYSETLSFYATLLWNNNENSRAYDIYMEIIKIKKEINLSNSAIVTDIDFLSEIVCLSNIANSANYYKEQFKSLSFVKEKIDDCLDTEKKERTIPFMNLCFFYYYRDINDKEKAIKYIKKAIKGYDICCHNSKTRMYIPDLIKCIYKYVNIVETINMEDFTKEVKYFEFLIDYVIKHKNYNDPYSYMKYLLSLYDIYKRNNISEEMNTIKDRLTSYYLHLSDSDKEDERLTKIMSYVRVQEE